MSRSLSILVCNQSHPEVNHLAAAICRRGMLLRYVRPYVGLGRYWERVIARAPHMPVCFRRTLARRRLADFPEPELIMEVGVLPDLLFAISGRLGRVGLSVFKVISDDYLKLKRAVAVDKATKKLVPEAGILVGNFCASMKSFSTAKLNNVKCVLNYPIAHHRFLGRLLQEEVELVPEFASTMGHFERMPPYIIARLDKECSLADMILVGSTFVRDSFVREGISSEKLCVVPYGVDLSRFRPPSTKEYSHSDSFKVLFVGQIGQRKGIFYLLEAYKRFRGAGTQLTLVGDFVGDERVYAPYQGMFKHIPRLPQAELDAIYSRADALVLPTLVEGMPLVVLEAMASGLPVVTTPNGPGDIVRDGIDGYVVPIRNPNAIVEKLEHLRNNKELLVEMGKNARERALGFTWRAYEDKALKNILALGAS